MTRFFGKAAEEARLLENSWIGVEHFLLAVLREPSTETETLGHLGLTHTQVRDFLASQRVDPPAPVLDSGADPRLNPRAYRLMGWTDGYAAARGRTPGQLDVLLGCLYVGETMPDILDHFGTSSDEVLGALSARGMDVPESAPPRDRPWRGHRRVYLDESELQAVLDRLNQRFPPGSEWRWGFNRTSEPEPRTYVDSEAGIDLEALVDDVRERESRGD